MADAYRPTLHHLRRRAAGFSLVELMVGIVIALLGTIVIFQVFSVSEHYKRTAVAGSDAQQNGAIGLFTLERDLRMAGFGLNDVALLGCSVRAYNADLASPSFNFSLTPLNIVQGAGNDAVSGIGAASDTITVMYGNSGSGMPSVNLVENMPSPSAVYKVSNRYGFHEGDLVIAAESGKDCTLAQVTGVPGSGNSDNVIHNSGNYTNASGAHVPAVYNKPSGLGVSYSANGKLYNLGSMPTRNIYSIQNNSLTVQSDLTGTSLQIADNIVNLQAVYCKDLAGMPPTSFTTCNAVDPAAGDWNRVGAVRIGLVARSTKPERDCNVTPSSSIPWSGGVFDISTLPDWSCYRYKVFQTTVPLRNLIWTP